jgi:hypothetical protein
MRRDDIAARREQKKHMMVELRSLGSRYDETGKPWAKPDAERRDYLLDAVTKINGELQAQHDRELEEIRSGGSSNGFQGTGLERSFAPEPLYQAFRSAGFARGERAEIPWQEFRSITWTGSVDTLNSPRRAAGALGYDQRYAYQALPSVGVDSGVTSISLLTQTARTLTGAQSGRDRASADLRDAPHVRVLGDPRRGVAVLPLANHGHEHRPARPDLRAPRARLRRVRPFPT